MTHPLVNKKDFNQALCELGISKKSWAKKRNITGEWLRKVLDGADCSHWIEREIIETVQRGEKARQIRHKKRQRQLNMCGKAQSTS